MNIVNGSEDFMSREAVAPPVFLVGCHRSGTTLMRYLLDSHPNLACPPESKFVAGLEAFLGYPQVLTGLAQLGVSGDQVLDALGRLARSFLDSYAEQQGKQRWIDKTPNYYRLLPLIDRLFGSETRYLFITRHPFDTIDSLERFPFFMMDEPEDPDVASALKRYGRTREGWGQYWCEVYEAIATFGSAHANRCLMFKYEELVCAPDAVVSRALRFIGEEPTPDLVAAAFRRSHTWGYGDWKVRESLGVHQTSIGKWHAWADAELDALWAITAPVAKRLGYEPPVRDPFSTKKRRACHG
jgi:hypothetical protein